MYIPEQVHLSSVCSSYFSSRSDRLVMVLDRIRMFFLGVGIGELEAGRLSVAPLDRFFLPLLIDFLDIPLLDGGLGAEDALLELAETCLISC